MAIQDKLVEAALQYRLQLAVVAAVVAAAVALVSVGPSFSGVAEFFWPLFVSTGFLLVAVAVIYRISPPPGEEGTSGEELIDYVAGRRFEEDVHMAPSEYGERRQGGADGAEEEEEELRPLKAQ